MIPSSRAAANSPHCTLTNTRIHITGLLFLLGPGLNLLLVFNKYFNFKLSNNNGKSELGHVHGHTDKRT